MKDKKQRYVVNKTYRSSKDSEKDQFLTWLNGPISNGIRNGGGIRSIGNPHTGDREFLVFVTRDHNISNQNPWEDVINLKDGVARFWGDAKPRDNPHPDNATGNGWVKSDYCRTYAQDKRSDAPPVLLFQVPDSGEVTFRGLCIITDLSVERHQSEGDIVVNYLFDLAILDVNAVDLEWIHRKARTGVDADGPDAWRDWVKTGRVNRYSVWQDSIRTKQAQFPEPSYKPLLENIRTKLDGHLKGEKLEILIEFLLDSLDNFSKVNQTARTGDRGVDLKGRINLLPDTPLGTTDTGIEFKAQVKNKGSSVSGKELSRLASRVEDGEIGLFFTTSYFTKQAQEENQTTYPIRLFSGGDIVKLLAQTELVDGRSIRDSVIKDIEKRLSE